MTQHHGQYAAGIRRREAGSSQAATLIALGTLPTMAIASLVPALPALFAHFGSTPNKELLVPMILTVPSLCVALFSAPIGAAADRWGRRPVLLIALTAFSLCGVLPMLFDDLYSIIASRVAVGVAEAAVHWVGLAFDAVGQFAGGFVLPTLIAWALTKYGYEHRGRGMGFWGGCFFLGQFLSPPVMTLIARGELSFLASVAVLGVLYLALAVIAAFFARSKQSAIAGDGLRPGDVA